jgi:hypothetical protein
MGRGTPAGVEEAVMGLLHRRREEVTEHHVELVRDAYERPRAWEMRPVRELFASGVPGHEAAWCVARGILPGGWRETDDLANELVAKSVPAHWEITRLDIHKLTSSRDRIVVVGTMSCRPKGHGAEPIKMPFLHIWHIHDNRVTRVESSLNSVELRRAA